MQAKYVAYLRVSTARQGRSGLGLEAQREAVQSFVASRSGRIIAPEYVEVESGKRNDRPELAKALKRCRATGATLVIAKLDRLSRDAHFLLGLQKAGVPFVAADMPEADETMVGFMAIFAQRERRMISERTKAALAAAKRRGVKLGNPGLQAGTKRTAAVARAAHGRKADEVAAQMQEPIAEARAAGATSLRAIAAHLNEQGFVTSRGCSWTAAAVQRVLARLEP